MMHHYIFGISNILASAVLFYLAYKQFEKNNFHYSVFLIVTAGFLLRVFVASDQFLHEWDERYHALVAKHMLDNFLEPKLYSAPLLPYDFKSWSSNYIWLHKQ